MFSILRVPFHIYDTYIMFHLPYIKFPLSYMTPITYTI